MKSKLTLTPAHEKSVRAAKEKLSDAFAERDKLTAGQSKLAKKLSALEREIADAERRVDPCDDSAVLSLTAKRNQAAMIQQKLSAMDAEFETADKRICGLVPEAAQAIADALAPQFEKDFDEAVKLIERFCDNEPQARERVKQFPYFLQQLYFSNWANVPSLHSAKRSLDYCDRILRGENVFEFQSEKQSR